MVKEERPRPSQRPDPSGLDSSSQSDVYIDSFAKDTTLTELAQALQFIWLLFSSTCPPKSWSWQEMLQETIKRHESYHDIFRWVFLARESIYNCGNYWILARDQKWRGIEQTTWWCYNSTRWCFTKYPSGSPSKKDFWRQINLSNRLFKIEHELENMWSLPNAVSLISWNKIKFDFFFKMKIESRWEMIAKFVHSWSQGSRDRLRPAVCRFVRS